MQINLRSRFTLYTAILLIISVSLFLSWCAWRNWLSYIYASTSPPIGFEEAIRANSGNSQFYFMLGEYYANDLSAPPNRVYELYKKALELSPLDYNYWYYLADFLSLNGKRDLALYTLNNATGLAPGVVSLRWGAGILASRLGDEEALGSNLNAVINYDTRRRMKAFSVLWQSLRNGEKIRRIVPENAYNTYMHFLLTTHRLDEAKKVWNKYARKDNVPADLFLRYVSVLISQNDFSSAKSAWTERLGAWEGVWNGDFEEKGLNAGFDWRMQNGEGVKIKESLDSTNKNHAIKIEFDGKHDVDFTPLSQLIPIKSQTTYKLSSLMKSNNITSRNGLFWQVNCPGNEKLSVRSEELRGTTDWHAVSLIFTTPEGCNYVVLRLKRLKTDGFGTNISGTVWIDKVVLEKLQ